MTAPDSHFPHTLQSPLPDCRRPRRCSFRSRGFPREPAPSAPPAACRSGDTCSCWLWSDAPPRIRSVGTVREQRSHLPVGSRRRESGVGREIDSYPCVVFRVLFVKTNRLRLAKVVGVVRGGGWQIVVHRRLSVHIAIRHHFSIDALVAFGKSGIRSTRQHISVVHICLRVKSVYWIHYRWRKGILPVMNRRAPSTDSTTHPHETTPHRPSSFSLCSCSALCCANARSSLFASSN